jgi:hypothetical protein
MGPRARALVFVAVFALAACGGRVSDPAADSGTGTGTSDGGASESSHGGQVFGVCPADAPGLGDPCVTPNQGCVYLYSGGGCVAFVCDGSSHWVSSKEGC